jgi:hypothetical protein
MLAQLALETVTLQTRTYKELQQQEAELRRRATKRKLLVHENFRHCNTNNYTVKFTLVNRVLKSKQFN